MKRFFLIATVLFGAILGSNAQTVTENGKFFDNTYISLTIGGRMKMDDLNKDLFHNNVYPSFNIYLGKWISPNFGLELNGEMGMHNSFKNNPNFVNGHYLGLSGMVNLNNLFTGYTGQPRKVEVIPFVGFGWLHSYGLPMNDNLSSTINEDGVATKMGVNLAINLCNDRAWQINIRPTVMYVLLNNKTPNFQYNVHRGAVALEVGVTYKFGYTNTKGERVHNFTSVPVPYYSQYEMDDREEVIQVIEDVIEVEKIVEVEKVVVKEENKYIVRPTFKRGSDMLDETSTTALKLLADEIKNGEQDYLVIGYASMEGDSVYNQQLSERRANVVKNLLVEYGVNPTRLITSGEGATDKFGSDYSNNRIVIITEQTN